MSAAMFMPQKANASAAPMIELLEQADMQKVVITTSESTITFREAQDLLSSYITLQEEHR